MPETADRCRNVDCRVLDSRLQQVQCKVCDSDSVVDQQHPPFTRNPQSSREAGRLPNLIFLSSVELKLSRSVAGRVKTRLFPSLCEGETSSVRAAQHFKRP